MFLLFILCVKFGLLCVAFAVRILCWLYRFTGFLGFADFVCFAVYVDFANFG